jgi:hypothetical protein
MPDKQRTRINVEVTAATVTATGRRFCGDHQGFANVDKGCIVRRGKSSRWVCFACQGMRAAAIDASLNQPQRGNR